MNSSDLYELIKSLSNNEKRNFKLFAFSNSNAKQRSYLLLFEILEKMKTYDESILVEKFKKENKLTQLHPMKSYLYKVILKSLNKYYSEKSSDYQLRNMLSSASILKDKGLHKRSKKILTKAKDLATKNENFDVLLEIYSFLANNLTEERISHLNEKKLVLKKIENLVNYEELLTSLAIEKTRIDQRKVSEKILRSPFLKKEDQAISITAKQLFHHIKSVCFYRLNDEKKSLEHLLRRKYYLEHSDEIFKKNIISYFACIQNIITIYTALKSYREAENLLDDMLIEFNKNLYTSNVQLKIFKGYAVKKLNLIIQTGQFKDATSSILMVEKTTDLYKNQIDTYELAIIYINISIIYFGRTDYKKALLWTNKALNIKTQNVDILVFIRIFNMIIHYESGNYELIFSLQRAFKYLTKRATREYRSEEIIVNFFNRIIPKINSENKQQPFKELKKELVDVFKNEEEANLLKYFDFLSWAEGKIQKKSFEEVVREKVNSK